MWIYKHYSCSDVIDLREESGRWEPISDDDRPSVGALSIAYRDGYPICGSYTIEDGQRYCMYWAEGHRFALMLPSAEVIDICRKHKDGRIEMLTPGIRCDIKPAKYSDGRLRQGFSQFHLSKKNDKDIVKIDYKSDYYLNFYENDFTAAAGFQTLADWDFFHALKEAIDYFSECAETGRIDLCFDKNGETLIEGRKVAGDDLIYGDTGKPAPRAGVWAAVSDLRATTFVNEGEKLPPLNGVDVSWVWSRNK